MDLREGLHPMKTIIRLPDLLYRQAKAEVALHGRKLQDLVEEGLRLVLRPSLHATCLSDLSGLMKQGLGVIESGILDLGSNAEHLKGFGSDASDR
jgi:hypothetical protein